MPMAAVYICLSLVYKIRRVSTHRDVGKEHTYNKFIPASIAREVPAVELTIMMIESLT